MALDNQRIASFEELKSIPEIENIPQNVSRRIVSRMKKVYDELHAHLYICMFLLLGAQTLSSSFLTARNRAKIPNVMPNPASLLTDSMNEGEYMPDLKITRQNGTIIARAIICLSRLSFTLFERLTLSFHLIRLASKDGDISTMRLRKHMMTIRDNRVAASETGVAAVSEKGTADGEEGSIRLPCVKALSTGGIISVASFGFIAHVFQQCCHSVTKVSLDCDFSVFRATADTAFDLECASEFRQVLRGSHKSCNKCYLLASTTFSVDGYNQVLL